MWNGERYIAGKEATTYTALASEAALQNNDPDQSVLCNACCRDHHDPTGAPTPKFSPRLDAHGTSWAPISRTRLRASMRKPAA